MKPRELLGLASCKEAHRELEIKAGVYEQQSKLLNGGYLGDYYRAIKEDTRSLNEGTYRV